MEPRRQMSSFECAICNETLESWDAAWVPSYRLIVGPVREPERGSSQSTE
jgi:hypothetical protein